MCQGLTILLLYMVKNNPEKHKALFGQTSNNYAVI